MYSAQYILNNISKKKSLKTGKIHYKHFTYDNGNINIP